MNCLFWNVCDLEIPPKWRKVLDVIRESTTNIICLEEINLSDLGFGMLRDLAPKHAFMYVIKIRLVPQEEL